jgi:hypothetical protein
MVGEKAHFSEHLHNSKYTDVLFLLMQDINLIQGMAKITHLPQLKSVVPRVYKFLPNTTNAFGWHNDLMGGRTLAFSVNLTKKPFEGGAFMIRKKHDHSVHFEYQNLGYGDAIFFLINDQLEHCVAPVTGSVERVAYAGWFLDKEHASPEDTLLA